MTATLEEHYVQGALRLRLISLKASKLEGLLLKAEGRSLSPEGILFKIEGYPFLYTIYQ